MITKRILKDIANVSTGYTFRSAIEPSNDGNTFVLQAKNINQDDYISDLENATRISIQLPRSNTYLKYNDVLLNSRGSGAGSFKTTVFKSNNKNVIASSSINVLRVKDERILPEYLALYLGSTDGQNMLAQIVSGSHIKSIFRKNLEEVKIPIPPVEKQKAIIGLHENIKKQEEISERRNQLNKNIINASLRSLTTAKGEI